MIMGDVSKEVVSACVCALPLAVRSAMHRRDTIRVAGGFGLPNSWRVAAAADLAGRRLVDRRPTTRWKAPLACRSASAGAEFRHDEKT